MFRSGGGRLRNDGRWGIIIGGGLMATVGGGCASGPYKTPDFLVHQGLVSNYLVDALEHPNPDRRRQAVQKISQTRYRAEDRVLEAFDVIARTDAGDQVRCAAIEGLARSNDRRALQTLIVILGEDFQAASSQEPRKANEGISSKTREETSRTRPAAADVKWATWRALHDFFEEDPSLARELAPEVAVLARRALKLESDRNVRILAARMLRHDASRDTLEALIEHLEDEDFGVVYACGQSLRGLTGYSLELNHQTWRDWLDRTQDPFAGPPQGAVVEAETNRKRRWWWLPDYFRSIDAGAEDASDPEARAGDPDRADLKSTLTDDEFGG